MRLQVGTLSGEQRGKENRVMGIRGFVVCTIYSCNIRRCTVMYIVQNWSEGGETPTQVEDTIKNC